MSILVQVMAWCCQATSHYPSQCWARFMSPYSFTRPQYVNPSLPNVTYMCQWTLWELRTSSGNGLSPVWRQAITWTNADLLSIRPLGTNFSEIWIKIQKFSFTKIHLKSVICKMAAILSRKKWVNVYIWLQTAWLAGILLVICTLTPRCDLFGVNLFIQEYHA